MVDPIVRPAAARDADQLVELETGARRSLEGGRGADRWLATHAELGADGWMARIAAGGVFVGTIDEVVVGYLVVGLPDDASSDVATVDQVYVLPEARELGFGDALLAAATERARAAGARWLEGEALPGDRETKNLYERAGIKARLITVSTPL